MLNPTSRACQSTGIFLRMKQTSTHFLEPPTIIYLHLPLLIINYLSYNIKLISSSSTNCSNMNNRSQRNKLDVSSICWYYLFNREVASEQFTQPIHFKQKVNNTLTEEANVSLYENIVKCLGILNPVYIPENDHNVLLSAVSNGSIEEICSDDGDGNEYFKARLNSKLLGTYSAILHELFIPSGFRIHNANLPIIFYNNKNNIGITHHDRDNSILYVVRGKKEINLALKDHVTKNYSGCEIYEGMGIYENVHPFMESDCSRKEKGWLLVTVTAGEALFIPKYVVHAVKSWEGTLGISFQVNVNIQCNYRCSRVMYQRMIKSLTRI